MDIYIKTLKASALQSLHRSGSAFSIAVYIISIFEWFIGKKRTGNKRTWKKRIRKKNADTIMLKDHDFCLLRNFCLI